MSSAPIRGFIDQEEEEELLKEADSLQKSFAFEACDPVVLSSSRKIVAKRVTGRPEVSTQRIAPWGKKYFCCSAHIFSFFFFFFFFFSSSSSSFSYYYYYYYPPPSSSSSSSSSSFIIIIIIVIIIIIIIIIILF